MSKCAEEGRSEGWMPTVDAVLGGGVHFELYLLKLTPSLEALEMPIHPLVAIATLPLLANLFLLALCLTPALHCDIGPSPSELSRNRMPSPTRRYSSYTQQHKAKRRGNNRIMDRVEEEWGSKEVDLT